MVRRWYKRRRPYSRGRYGRSSRWKGKYRRTRFFRKRRTSKTFSKRKAWHPAISYTPLRTFIFNDSGYVFSLNSGAPTSTHVFRGNSIWDPDYTGVEVTTYGRAEAAAYYNRYFCTSSKITVWWGSTLAGAGVPLKVWLVPYRANALPTTDTDFLTRMPGARMWTFGGLNNPPKMKNYCTFKKAFTGSDIIALPNGDTTGVMNGNPVIMWYWHLVVTELPLGEDIDIYFDVKIKYYTKLLNKNLISF